MAIVLVEIAELERIVEAAIRRALSEDAQSKYTDVVTENSRLLNIDEVAALLKVSKSTVNNYKRAGKIPFHRIGRQVLFKESEVLDSLRKASK